MTKLIAIMSMSLDGYVADANDGVGRKLEGWVPPNWRLQLAGATYK